MDYTYDAAGQLTAATNPNGPVEEEAYSYDANGNRTNTGDVTGANNKLVSDGTYDYEYDADGNMIEQTNIVTNSYTTYAYNYRNELTTVTDYTNTGTVTETVTYTYDALDRRISETVAIGDSTTTTKFVYDGQNIVATLDGTNALTNRYLDGPGVDQVFADEQFTPTEAGQLPTSAGTVIYPLVDNLGTDRDLVEYSAGVTSVVDHLGYNSFGAVTGETNPAISYLFGYTGFIRDLATGLNDSGSREENPADGDWTQEDPIGFAGGQANVSEYVGNSPTNWIDPRGLDGIITGGNGFFDHQGVTIDVYDSTGDLIGTLSADYSASGWGGRGGTKCFGFEVLLLARAHVVLGFTPNGKVQGGCKGWKGDFGDSNSNALQNILSSVGKDYKWLSGEIAAGNASWDLPSAWSSTYYNVFFNSCQNYAAYIMRSYEPIEQWGP